MRHGARQGSAASAKLSWVRLPPICRFFLTRSVSATWLAPRAVAIAARPDHPLYNCLYLALAEAEQADLVTADTQLVGKVRATSWEQLTVSLCEYGLGDG